MSNKNFSKVGIKFSIACLASASFFNLSLEPAKAGCNEFDFTCNPHVKPILKPAVEELWGDAGSAAYQAAAITMRERNGGGQDLDETQKRFLRQRYGGLVDQVRVSYGSRMMDEWCALGKCTSTDSAAQTYCDRIYVRDSYKRDDTDQLMLLAHEMRHSEQCRDLGGAGKFGFHYFREFKRADQTYATNSMEVEARDSAKDFARNVICPQVGCPPTSGQYWQNYDNLGIDLPISLKKPLSIGERFDKPGNNGTVSCDTFCGAVNVNNQPVWGSKVGVNIGSRQPEGASGVCQCAQSSDFFTKKGNNGTVTCDTFCSGSQWGQVGMCIASFDNRNGTGQGCDYLPGFLGGSELTCSCSR
ncbi:MAG: DUF4157 domain-containing protein [Pseudanabaenaceae cyanobacterium bins.39]|nr:DUF4157 domain-containing protein [Pseudanabaenaceae cyanobacterium bins.39]